jgi:hypothetical protein
VAARLEAIHDKTNANQISLEPESVHQEKMDAWIAAMKDDRKERTACQEATEANPEKMEPNTGEKEAVMERQEIPNKEATIHSLRACRKKTMTCQERTEACLECEELTSAYMKFEAEHLEVSKQYAALETGKVSRSWHLFLQGAAESKTGTRNEQP